MSCASIWAIAASCSVSSGFYFDHALTCALRLARTLCARSRRSQPAGNESAAMAWFASTRAIAAATLAAGLAVAALPAWPDSYPSRPIHLIVGFAPGGSGDIFARVIGARLAAELGQSVVV